MRPILATVDVATVRQPVPFGDPLAVYEALADRFGERDVYLLESAAGPAADCAIAVVGFRRLLSVSIRQGTIRLDGVPDLVAALTPMLGHLLNPDGELAVGATVWDVLRALQRSFDATGSASGLSFGFLAFFGYDTIYHIERLSRKIAGTDDMPDIMLVLYQGFARQDTATGTAEIVVHQSALWPGLDPDEVAALLRERGAGGPVPAAPPIIGEVIDSSDQAAFEENVRRCLAHIAVGDSYQVQIGHELTIQSASVPVDVYRRLRERNPSPYMYLADVAGRRLIGASPELFVRVADGRITMRPIAGTAPRDGSDAEVSERLRNDPKEIAEHVMLIDLCRNDIGRVCQPGSLAVTDMCAVEVYSHVLHLVSTVTGRAEPELDAYDIVTALFPAGTMTGAPKIRSMEIIEDVETTRRGAYAGAIGLLDVGGYVNLALCIRMLVHDGESYRTRASAGVVADSSPAGEWRETRAKLSAAYWAVTGEEYNA